MDIQSFVRRYAGSTRKSFQGNRITDERITKTEQTPQQSKNKTEHSLFLFRLLRLLFGF